MGLFKRFSAPKARIELKLDEVAYNYTDKLTGKIAVDSEEDVMVNEFRLEFSGNQKIKWKKGFSNYSTSTSLPTRKIPVGSSVTLQKGQHYEQTFQIDMPSYSIPDPFTEIDTTVKGVATIQGRPDLTHEVKPAITFPYVIDCLMQYGGCGFATQPLSEPVKVCPRCSMNLEEVWNRKYSDEARKAAQGTRR